MKKLEIIIKPEDLDDLREVLVDNGATGMMISNIMGFGNQMGIKQSYRGNQYVSNFLPKIKVETVTTDEKSPELIKAVSDVLNSGEIGSGKIFIYNVDDAVRIRTGETGDNAII